MLQNISDGKLIWRTSIHVINLKIHVHSLHIVCLLIEFTNNVSTDFLNNVNSLWKGSFYYCIKQVMTFLNLRFQSQKKKNYKKNKVNNKISNKTNRVNFDLIPTLKFILLYKAMCIWQILLVVSHLI